MAKRSKVWILELAQIPALSLMGPVALSRLLHLSVPFLGWEYS